MKNRYSRHKQTAKSESLLRPYLVSLALIGLGIFAVWHGGKILAEKFQSGSSSTSTSSSSQKTDETSSSEDSTTVCLDPGHGSDDDPGATNGDLIERDINLIVANKVKATLEADGYNVVLTRTDNDTALTNSERAAICNDADADLLVSIHHNDYGDDSSVDHTLAIYYKDSDVDFATTMVSTLADSLDLTNDGISSLEDNVLVKSNMPAVLTEAFFVSNDYEKSLVDDVASTRLDEEAQGIVKGIKKYLSESSSED